MKVEHRIQFRDYMDRDITAFVESWDEGNGSTRLHLMVPHGSLGVVMDGDAARQLRDALNQILEAA